LVGQGGRVTVGWLFGWLESFWFIGWLVGWLEETVGGEGKVVGWSGWTGDWFIGCLVGWKVWLVGWLVGWLKGKVG
jgi:hypothetical protein